LAATYVIFTDKARYNKSLFSSWNSAVIIANAFSYCRGLHVGEFNYLTISSPLPGRTGYQHAESNADIYVFALSAYDD